MEVEWVVAMERFAPQTAAVIDSLGCRSADCLYCVIPRIEAVGPAQQTQRTETDGSVAGVWAVAGGYG